MLNSSTFSTNNNNNTTTSPILDVDNIFSYLIDDLNPNNSKQQDFLPNHHVFTTSSYHHHHHHHHLPSPSIYNYDNFLSNHELEFLQQSFDDSPILEEDDLNKVEDREIDEKVENNNVEMNHTTTNNKTVVNRRHHVMKKKKTSNKDRHSKIRTAHGLRERRMRLSLQVARPFFNLQDVLGFDKGSRTLEWLLMQSKSSIEEIAQRKQLQGSGRPTTTAHGGGGGGGGDSGGGSTSKKKMMKKKGCLSSTCVKEDDETKPKRTMTKEKRKVARERAKMRTLERMQSKEDYHGIGSTQLPLSSINKLGFEVS